MTNSLIRNWKVWIAAILLALVALELLLRLLLDFPLYGADNQVGYYPLPSQHGSFLLKNDWTFNAQGMGVAQDYRPSGKLDVLLVGDSVVYGGNRFGQDDKLGPLIAHDTGWQVWPASAGSWALQNELAYLARYPDAVDTADVIVFVLNSEDFGKPSSWASQLTHPRRKPRLYISYAIGKVLKIAPAAATPEALRVPPSADLERDWHAFLRRAGGKVRVIAYPMRAESGEGCAWLPTWIRQEPYLSCYQPGGAPAEELYRDPIHPAVRGNRAFARFVEGEIRTSVAGAAAPR